MSFEVRPLDPISLSSRFEPKTIVAPFLESDVGWLAVLLIGASRCRGAHQLSSVLSRFAVLKISRPLGFSVRWA